MDWSFLYLLMLIGMVVEAGREAYGIKVPWSTKHFTRLMPFGPGHRPERDFWTERKNRRERRAHRQHWHIDLLALQRRRGRK